MSETQEKPEVLDNNQGLLKMAIVGAVLALITPILIIFVGKNVYYIPPRGGIAELHVIPWVVFPLISLIGTGLTFIAYTSTSVRRVFQRVVLMLAFFITILVLLTVLSSGQHWHAGAAKTNYCIANQKSMVTAIQLYADEHDGALPPAADFWNPAIMRVERTKCLDIPHRKIGYIANGRICGKSLAAIPDPAHTFLTADGQAEDEKLPNIGRYYEDFNAGRHRYKGKGYVVASFLDGHVDIAVPVADDPHWLPGRGTP